MNEVAIAVLFSIDTETEKTSADIFRSDDHYTGDLDPYHRAQGLRDSVADDFPNRLWSIAINDEARRLMRNARMRAMGFTGPGYEEYAR